MMKLFFTACNNIGVDVDYIPAVCTCVLQPVDVGFNAPFKRHIQDCHCKCCIEKFRGDYNAMKLPTPDRDNIITWVHEAYEKISEISHKTFQSIGFRCAEFEEEDNHMVEFNIEDKEEEGTIDT
jgi:hypothetical protein